MLCAAPWLAVCAEPWVLVLCTDWLFGLMVWLGRLDLALLTGQVDSQASSSCMIPLNRRHMPGLFMKQAAPPPRISWWSARLMSAMHRTCDKRPVSKDVYYTLQWSVCYSHEVLSPCHSPHRALKVQAAGPGMTWCHLHTAGCMPVMSSKRPDSANTSWPRIIPARGRTCFPHT